MEERERRSLPYSGSSGRISTRNGQAAHRTGNEKDIGGYLPGEKEPRAGYPLQAPWGNPGRPGRR